MTQSLTWLLFILPMWSRGDLRWLHDRCNSFCLSQHGISTINSPCTFFISPLKYLITAVSPLIFDIGLLCCVFLSKKSCCCFFQGRFSLLSSLHMDAVFFTLSLFACLLSRGHFHLRSLYSNWPLIISKTRYSCSDINQFWLNERISSLLLYTRKESMM